MTLKDNTVLEVIKVEMCVQNIIKLNAAVHELSCIQTFLPYLATVKKIQKSGPVTLTFDI